jgi:hypothetical protein
MSMRKREAFLDPAGLAIMQAEPEPKVFAWRAPEIGAEGDLPQPRTSIDAEAIASSRWASPGRRRRDCST